MGNKDTIIEALTMQLRLEREGNLAFAKRNCDNCESLRKAAWDRIKELEAKLEKREWVGLTDEECVAAISGLFDAALMDGNVPDEIVIEYARAIEAKLKEKNT